MTWAPISGREALVVMALWNRPARLQSVLELLDGQDYPHGIRLFLWNNRGADHAFYSTVVRQFRSTSRGSIREVSLARSPHNLGSIGRWYWARALQRRGIGSSVIVIDDDQDFGADFVSKAMDAARPRTIVAWWAWVIRTTYHDRVRARPGDRIDHVGPGASVTDLSLFADAAFFTDIPDQYRMLDDLWITYFARRSGFELAVLDVDIEFVLEETNQYHGQIDLKTMFYDHLYPRESHL